jgi:DNA (cytosine-5)-methyltransferase 1
MKRIKYFSMFSGIGGFELGIQRAFMQPKDERLQVETDSGSIDSELLQRTTSCVGYSEIDKYAIKVYERQFYGHKNYGDATTIVASELPDFDLLVGGFPCQAFSIAGKRKGFDDTRGTLFFDIARVLAEKRPKHLVLENVKGLLSHDSGRTFTTIIGVLTDLGYSVEWQVLNSKDFGVPQNRERIYFVGHLRGECSGQVFPITNNSKKTIKYDVKGSQRDRVYNKTGVAPTIPTMQGGNTHPKIADYRYDEGLRIRKNNISPTVRSEYKSQDHSKSALLIKDAKIRRLTPLECERLQGFPDNWTAGESDTQRYKMCGNAVTVNTVQAVMERLFNEKN